MATIVPPGVNINQSTEDPFDRLLKMISVGSSIAGQIRANQSRRDTQDINTLNTIGKMFGNANDSTDLEFANKYISDMGYSNNEGVNIIKEELSRQISEKDTAFRGLQTSGNELARMITKTNDILGSDGNVVSSKRFKDMNEQEVQQWFGSIKPDDGYLGQITEQLNKIKVYKQNMANTFGASVTKDGRYVFTKTPNMSFDDSSGGQLKATEFLNELDRYEDRLRILIETGFSSDGIINFEEAQHIIMGDLNYYKQVKNQRQEEFKLGASTVRSQKNQIVDDIKSLVKKSDDMSELFMDANVREKFGATFGIEGAAELYLTKYANVPISGDEEDMREQILNSMATMGKQDLQMYYNELLADLNVKEEAFKSGAIAWGFGGYFGVYPKDETVFSGMFEDDTEEQEKETVKEKELRKVAVKEKVIKEQNITPTEEQLKQFKITSVPPKPGKETFRYKKMIKEIEKEQSKDIAYRDLTKKDRDYILYKALQQGVLGGGEFKPTDISIEQFWGGLSIEEKSKFLNKNLKKGYTPSYKK